jgi:hypothetical protein
VRYKKVPERIGDAWKRIAALFEAEVFAAFQGLTMVQLMRDFEARAVHLRYTEAICERFRRSFRRMLDSMLDAEFESYRSRTDNLLKDLGLCRQLLFPAGARIVERDSGFPRSLLLRAGPAQAWHGLSVLLKSGANKPFFESHVHLLELEEVNALGWHRYLLAIAELLERNPHVRGIFGVSWLYDPALEEISPRIAYHLQEPLRNGATLLFSHVDVDGGALAKSETRRQRYAAGTYMPRAYALIWPRRALIRWARIQRYTNAVAV